MYVDFTKTIFYAKNRNYLETESMALVIQVAARNNFSGNSCVNDLLIFLCIDLSLQMMNTAKLTGVDDGF